MGKRRRILGVLVLLGLLTAAAGTWFVAQARLPDPAQCDRTELLLWLVTRHLEQEPFDLRLRLIDRLEQEMRGDFDAKLAKQWLTEARQEQLDKNVAALVEAWFFARLEHYFALPAPERAAYVDQLLDRLVVLRGARAAAGRQEPARGARLAKVLLEQVPEWQRRADPKRRVEISEFLVALQTRWLARGLFGASPPDRRQG